MLGRCRLCSSLERSIEWDIERLNDAGATSWHKYSTGVVPHSLSKSFTRSVSFVACADPGPRESHHLQMASKMSSPTVPLPPHHTKHLGETALSLAYRTEATLVKICTFLFLWKWEGGLILGFPSVKMVSCTVHWCLSSPDDARHTQTVDELVVS